MTNNPTHFTLVTKPMPRPIKASHSHHLAENALRNTNAPNPRLSCLFHLADTIAFPSIPFTYSFRKFLNLTMAMTTKIVEDNNIESNRM